MVPSVNNNLPSCVLLSPKAASHTTGKIVAAQYSHRGCEVSEGIDGLTRCRLHDFGARNPTLCIFLPSALL